MSLTLFSQILSICLSQKYILFFSRLKKILMLLKIQEVSTECILHCLRKKKSMRNKRGFLICGGSVFFNFSFSSNTWAFLPLSYLQKYPRVQFHHSNHTHATTNYIKKQNFTSTIDSHLCPLKTITLPNVFTALTSTTIKRFACSKLHINKILQYILFWI